MEISIVASIAGAIGGLVFNGIFIGWLIGLARGEKFEIDKQEVKL